MLSSFNSCVFIFGKVGSAQAKIRIAFEKVVNTATTKNLERVLDCRLPTRSVVQKKSRYGGRRGRSRSGRDAGGSLCGGRSRRRCESRGPTLEGQIGSVGVGSKVVLSEGRWKQPRTSIRRWRDTEGVATEQDLSCWLDDNGNSEILRHGRHGVRRHNLD